MVLGRSVWNGGARATSGWAGGRWKLTAVHANCHAGGSPAGLRTRSITPFEPSLAVRPPRPLVAGDARSPVGPGADGQRLLVFVPIAVLLGLVLRSAWVSD